jgi:hypothetical protein
MSHTRIEIQQDTSVIEVYSVGIQGPQGASGTTGSIRQLTDVDLDSQVVDESVLAYNSSADKWENLAILDGGAP